MVSKEEKQLKMFLGRATHDILSPIHTIQGLTKLVLEEPEIGKRKKYCEMLLKTADHLSHTVKSLIKEYYGSRIITEQIDLSNMTKKILQHLQPAEDIKIEINDHVTNPFFSYSDKIASVLQNLIENSIRYRRNQNSKVNIQFDELDTGILIAVADNGVGIPITAQSNIFQEGFRVNHDNHGHGLGLYLVKSLVDELGGKIELESSSAGTIFYVKLPSANS
jgi:signal transduction histidine kinase